MALASGVILAGGHSRRLGRNKALVRIGGVPLIERVAGRLRELSDDLLIVTNTPDLYRGLGGRLIGDVCPGMGSLGGIYSGLAVARHERALVVGCDMPFLNPALLSHMIELSEQFDVVIPSFDGYKEPLHAVYGLACLAPIAAQLRSGDLRIISFLSQVRVCYLERAELERLDPQLLSLFNVNTPQDLERAQELAATRR
ncbi:MAG TPA: molybdenum cofactor guanylyltransferase [Anaerolineae bacterium]|nr:molybdenum cofactor guanylyltransferase [Anaerolineae bacterium]HPL29911.1 molybdenum cofactor guanylyltransferase [Anaerolineae bacterium]